MGTSSEETDRSSLASERAGARARALDRVARARNGVAARTCFSVAAFIWGFVFAGPIGAGPPRRFAGDFFAFAKPRAPIAGTAIDATVTVDVKIRPNVNGETVTFGLTAPHLEEALNEVLRTVHAQLADTANRGTGIEPLWTA